MKAHDPHTPAGRAGLARVVAYERKRFGWVRATVAERLLAALLDEHARPANDPAVRDQLNLIAHEVHAGNVAGVALTALQLIELARQNSPARRAAK